MRKPQQMLWTLAALAVLAAPMTLDSVLKHSTNHRSIASVQEATDDVAEDQPAIVAEQVEPVALEEEILEPIAPIAELQPLDLPLIQLVGTDHKPEVGQRRERDNRRRNSRHDRRPSGIPRDNAGTCKVEEPAPVPAPVAQLQTDQTQILQILLSMVQMQTQMMQTMQTMITNTNGFNYFSMPQNNGLIGQMSPLSLFPSQYTFNPFMQQQSPQPANPFQQPQQVINNYNMAPEAAQFGMPQTQPAIVPGLQGGFNFGGVDDSSRPVFGNFGPLVSL